MTLVLRPTIKLTKRNSLNSVILPLSLILFLLCQINQIITIKQKQTPTTNCCPKRNGQILNLNPLPFFFSISYQTSFVWLYWCISNKTFLSFSKNSLPHILSSTKHPFKTSKRVTNSISCRTGVLKSRNFSLARSKARRHSAPNWWSSAINQCNPPFNDAELEDIAHSFFGHWSSIFLQECDLRLYTLLQTPLEADLYYKKP